jgi:ATP-dependent DNA helicase RecG
LEKFHGAKSGDRTKGKRSLPPRAKWLKSIIAFANGAGGELILGVDDKSRDIVRRENPL